MNSGQLQPTLGNQAIELAVCRLSILECQVKPLREDNKLRASAGLKTPDALQAAAAIVWGDDVAFVTADESFLRVPALSVHLIKI